MSIPEEIPNIEHFPLSPRMSESFSKRPAEREEDSIEELPQRTLTPIRNVTAEFWHQGDKAAKRTATVQPKNFNHAKRADQLGLLLAIIAAIVLTVMVLTLYLTNKKYNFKGGAKKVSTPEINFYQGNAAFLKKVQEEKDAKAGVGKSDVESIIGANEQLEISLKDQMQSMSEKLETMRSQKLLEEEPIPLPEKVRKPDPLTGVRPTEIKNFNEPLEFNSMLPKALQNGH